MKRILFLKILVAIFITQPIMLLAQSNTEVRAELQSLLVERKDKFGAYSASLEKRSGFFGGKTKHDIQQSNEVLREIILTDNKIMNVLNRVADFKTFEKVNMDYDLMKCNRDLEKMKQLIETLNVKATSLQSETASLQTKILRMK